MATQTQTYFPHPPGKLKVVVLRRPKIILTQRDFEKICAAKRKASLANRHYRLLRDKLRQALAAGAEIEQGVHRAWFTQMLILR